MQDETLRKRLTLGYSLGLLLIASLSVGAHFLLDAVIVQQHDSATVINVAGRQRMLSQRIALLSSAVEDGEEGSIAKLVDAVDLMERSQDALINGADLAITHGMSADIRLHYFEGPYALDPMVRRFISAARTQLETSDSSVATASAAEIRAESDDLLSSLDMAVALFEAEANSRIQNLRGAQTIVLIILLCTLVLEALFIFRPLVNLVRSYIQKLYALATQDSLTGLANRGSFIDQAEQVMSLALRKDLPLAMLAFDIDHFKTINDKFGHAMGDKVLQHFAMQLRSNLRKEDIVGRVGGEEFIAILPMTDAEEAQKIAERVRLSTASHSAELPQVTVSVGGAMRSATDKALDGLMSRADKVLYEAKNAGRNRVVFES